MKHFLIAVAFVLFSGGLIAASAQSFERCFTSDWLQGTHEIDFTVTGIKVTGEYSINHGSNSAPLTYAFTGTLRGNQLTVKFAGDKLPDMSPSEMKSNVWTISGRGQNAVLRIKVFGKNYRTNKYRITYAKYPACPMKEAPDMPGIKH